MKTIKILALLFLFASLVQSCRTGYGCQGTGKYITRVPHEKFNGYK